MPNPYVIPGRLFASLARGHGGSSAGRWLAGAERSKRLLLLRGVVHSAAVASHPQIGQIRRAYQVLADIQQQSRDAVEAVLMQPAIAAWAVETIQRLGNGTATGLEAGRMSAIAAAAAIRARAEFTGVLAADEGWVMIPSLGRALLGGVRAGMEAEIVVTPSRTEIRACGERMRIPDDPHCDLDAWQGMRPIVVAAGDRRLKVMVDDIDPYRFAAFPGVGRRLTAAELAEWRAKLAAAFQLLVMHHSRVADELLAMITVLTPLAIGPLGQAHATSRDTFGCIALSHPRDGRSLALALAHEIQHAKLTALLDLVDLIGPMTTSELFYAPWRDDPRPLPALLHGTYAFLGVAGFWRRQRQHENGGQAHVAHSEFARWRAATTEATIVLAESPDITVMGHRFLDGMQATLRQWQQQPLPAAAAQQARAVAEIHRKRWQQNHGS